MEKKLICGGDDRTVMAWKVIVGRIEKRLKHDSSLGHNRESVSLHASFNAIKSGLPRDLVSASDRRTR
jgi:hypothetical protein